MIVITNNGSLQLNILVCHMHPSIYLSALWTQSHSKTAQMAKVFPYMFWSGLLKKAHILHKQEKKKGLKYGLIFNLF